MLQCGQDHETSQRKDQTHMLVYFLYFGDYNVLIPETCCIKVILRWHEWKIQLFYLLDKSSVRSTDKHIYVHVRRTWILDKKVVLIVLVAEEIHIDYTKDALSYNRTHDNVS